MKTSRTITIRKTFENKQELLQHFYSCFDRVGNLYRPAQWEIETLRQLFRDSVAKTGGYQIVSNGYGQFKEIRFDNSQNPISAKYLFMGIAAKQNYPFTVEYTQ